MSTELTTKKPAKDAMADEQESSKPPAEVKASQSLPSFSTGGGYFHIYKKGQGYWTRICTVAGVALVGLLTGGFLYEQIEAFSTGQKTIAFLSHIHLQEPRAAYLVVVGFSIIYAIVAFHYINKPGSVDFLIATDSEMKKVNWTSRKELIGSTKVVIGFMFVMAVMLLVYDLFFQLLFYLLGVLKTPPFFLGH
jgi:preprotein translocase subunit SecE